MGEKDWRYPIQGAAKAAADLPYINMAGVAKHCGWSAQSLDSFVKNGTGSEEKIQKLSELLAELGVLREDPLRALATQFIALGWSLRAGNVSRVERVHLAHHTVMMLARELKVLDKDRDEVSPRTE